MPCVLPFPPDRVRVPVFEMTMDAALVDAPAYIRLPLFVKLRLVPLLVNITLLLPPGVKVKRPLTLIESDAVAEKSSTVILVIATILPVPPPVRVNPAPATAKEALPVDSLTLPPVL